jgi:hypothetical protein
LARSRDGGKTFELEGRLHVSSEGLASPDDPHLKYADMSRLTYLGGGEVVALMHRTDRSLHPDLGFANPETGGFAPTNFVLRRSHDYGHSWDAPEVMAEPLSGSPTELSQAIQVLSDGTWIFPVSLWPDWEGKLPHGVQTVAYVSRDQGRSWPEAPVMMRDPEQRKTYWETRIVELEPNRLLTVTWVFDRQEQQNYPNGYTLSEDNGQTWCAVRSTGLNGQTLDPVVLPDGRILSLYRRMDQPGLWANLSRLEDGVWVNEAEEGLWGLDCRPVLPPSANIMEQFAVLQFGAPCTMMLPDGTVYSAFWGYEANVSHIRWFRLAVD